MNEFLVASLSAVGIGILTSVHPCPFATNLAAFSFILRKAGSLNQTFFESVMYVLGRIVAYVLLGILIVHGALSIASVGDFLQYYVNRLLGPLLIVVGMLIAGLIHPHPKSRRLLKSVSLHHLARGSWGALALGILLALSFCPASAGLFFGVLIPLALKHESGILFPTVYGLGTGIPLLVLALAVSKGVSRLDAWKVKRPSWIEQWLPAFASAVLILLGVYFSLKYAFRLVS